MTARTQPPAIAVPRPINAPRQGLTFSPSIVVVALLTVFVLAFGVYLGVQVLRFAKPPTIAVTDPATAVIDVDEATTSYTLRGHDACRAPRSPSPRPAAIHTRSPPVRTGLDGRVDLRRGRNQFDVTALDPDTGKRSETTIRLFITVPFLAIEAPTLTVDQPAEGTTFENGAIPVAGRPRTPPSVVVSAEYVGPRSGASRRQGDAGPAAAARARSGHGRRSPRTARSARRSS